MAGSGSVGSVGHLRWRYRQLPWRLRLLLPVHSALLVAVAALGCLALTRGARGAAALVSWFAVVSGIIALAFAIVFLLAVRKALERARREGRSIPVGDDGPKEPHPSGGGVAEASYRAWVERRATRRGVPLGAQIRSERSLRMVVDVNVPLIAAFTCSLCVASIAFDWGSGLVTVLILMYAVLWILMGIEVHSKASIHLEVLEYLRRSGGPIGGRKGPEAG